MSASVKVESVLVMIFTSVILVSCDSRRPSPPREVVYSNAVLKPLRLEGMTVPSNGKLTVTAGMPLLVRGQIQTSPPQKTATILIYVRQLKSNGKTLVVINEFADIEHGPDGEKAYSVDLTAPDEPGNYVIQVRFRKDVVDELPIRVK